MKITVKQIDEMASEYAEYQEGDYVANCIAFKAGFNKAIEQIIL